MLSVVAGLVFAVASIGCAHRLRYARRAWEYLAFVPFVIGGWVALLTVRTPTAGSMLVSGLLLDMTIMLLACTGIFRMLGAFESDPWTHDKAHTAGTVPTAHGDAHTEDTNS